MSNSSINRILNFVNIQLKFESLLVYRLNSDEEQTAEKIIIYLLNYSTGKDFASSDEELDFDSENELDEYFGCGESFEISSSSYASNILDYIQSSPMTERTKRLLNRNNKIEEIQIDSDYVVEEPDHKKQKIFDKFTNEKIKNVSDLYHRNGHNVTAVMKEYRVTKREVYECVNYIQDGNDFEKYEQIKKDVFEQFKLARENAVIVKDYDILNWIRLASLKYQPKKKCLSISFFKKFKKDYKISSRRVTRFVQSSNFVKEEEILESARVFVEQVREHADENLISDDDIWNSDQSRFEKEIASNRTYESTGMQISKKNSINNQHLISSFNTGTKIVLAKVVSESSLTHSYSGQVNLNKSGHLGRKMYICLQEPSGTFGPQVQKDIDWYHKKYVNLQIECTQSGKLNKPQLLSWMKNCMAKDFQLGSKSLLLLDSWGTHKDEDSLKAKCKKDFDIMIIPKSTTKYIQPCDVFFFRQYKIIVKRIQEIIRKVYFEEESVKPHNREFILKMHSLVYNQLSSNLFNPMIQFAWIKSGYSDRLEDFTFENTKQIMFSNIEDCYICETIGFLVCSHCRKSICFDHFIMNDNYHYHHV